MFGVGGAWVASWAEADQRIHQMLPLAVGNSWMYRHFAGSEEVTIPGLEMETNWKEVTISISHTEDIEGHTYHVFSDMPYEDPPVPYFFIAGKKVRWEGDLLLFRQQDRDVALFRFDHSVFENPERYEWWKPVETYEYVIPKTDTLVIGFSSWTEPDHFQGIPRIGGCLQLDNRFVFYFSFPVGRSWAEADERIHRYPSWRAPEAKFIEGFGMSHSFVEARDDRGHIHLNEWGYVLYDVLTARYAVINGEKFDFWIDPRGKVLDTRDESPCVKETAIKKLLWGVLKQEFLHLSKPGDLE